MFLRLIICFCLSFLSIIDAGDCLDSDCGGNNKLLKPECCVFFSRKKLTQINVVLNKEKNFKLIDEYLRDNQNVLSESYKADIRCQFSNSMSVLRAGDSISPSAEGLTLLIKTLSLLIIINCIKMLKCFYKRFLIKTCLDV
jgi:uncharacterized protein YnzC (UPF0291/DUF896 family)